MCTYQTEQLPVSGSGKGPARWLRVTEASVYVDHPVHAMAGHTLNSASHTSAGSINSHGV